MKLKLEFNKNQIDIVIDSLTLYGDLAIGYIGSINTKLNNLGIIGAGNYKEILEDFYEMFYGEDRSIVTFHKNVEVIYLINLIYIKITSNQPITEKEADILITALDLYTRLGLGQFEYLNFFMSYVQLKNPRYEERRQLFKRLKREYFSGTGDKDRYGVDNEKVSERIQIAFDMCQRTKCELSNLKTLTADNKLTLSKTSTTEELV